MKDIILNITATYTNEIQTPIHLSSLKPIAELHVGDDMVIKSYTIHVPLPNTKKVSTCCIV